MVFAIRLAETQINFYPALQAIEFFGMYSLDGIVALSNIMLFVALKYLFQRDQVAVVNSKWPWLISLFVIGAWFTYGVFSYSQWQIRQADWPTLNVGIVQPNEVPSLQESNLPSGFGRSYPPEMAITEDLSGLGAELIVWPEAQVKHYMNQSGIQQAYKKNIAALDSSLLFQDMQEIRDTTKGKRQSQFNTAIMINASGQQTGVYQKIKRIPFGEYVPLVSDDSQLKNWMEGFLGEFLNEVSSGKSHQVFIHEKVNIIPLICYETTFPSFVGNAVKKTREQINKANGSLLVALSNDGWFGFTRQPYQHIDVSSLRAVENRMPLVHVANNGPSIVALPSGEIVFRTELQKAGGYLTKVPYSVTAQGSFYSRYPSLFDWIVRISMLLLIVSAVIRRKKVSA